MVTFYYKDNQKKLLSKNKRDAIAEDIKEKFKLWYSDLKVAREDAVKLLKDLYPGYDNDVYKIKKVPSTYEQLKTYESAIYRATYQNYDGMIDIEGQNLRSNNIASIYKASLVYDYNKINLKETLDKILFDWCVKGEGAAYVYWSETYSQVPIIADITTIDEFGNINIEQIASTRDELENAGVYIKHIDPHNLYYDKTQKSNWQSCGKIYRDFIPIQSILANEDYNLTAQERNELKELVRSNADSDISNLHTEKIDADTTVLNTSVEVLEYYGDYCLPDNYDVIRNAEIVIIAGKYIARIEKSKRPKCPIVYGCYMERPDTTRGQSPMKNVGILNEVENMCIDLTLRAWQLNVDPVFLTPKGAFSTYTRLVPGKPLEYDPNILGGQSPQKVDFTSGLRGFDFETFFKNKIEGATGITQYLLGSQDGSVRTASESTYIHAGASMRIAREAYLFQSRIILPIVKLHALYKKIFDTNNPTIRLSDGTFVEVTDEIRTGNYTFIIGDSQTSVERDAETNKLFQLLGTPAFQSLINLMDTQTASEILRWLLNRMNFRATDQIFDILNLNKQIQNLGTQLGVRPENIEGFRQAMIEGTNRYLPQIAQNITTENIR